MGSDPNQQGASRRWIITAAENSLRRLQYDHIDVYQIHRPDPDTDIEETLASDRLLLMRSVTAQGQPDAWFTRAAGSRTARI